ncbi:MAG TPA: hypothetical protein VF255_08965 [Solirubrobacterales bacterium]
MPTADQRIGEIDFVSFKEAIEGWPAGTTGTVVADFGNDKMVEISNDRGEALGFPVAPVSKLELLVKYS